MINYDIFYYTIIILIVCLIFYLDDYQRYKWLFKPNNALLTFIGVCGIILIKHFIRNNGGVYV